MEDDATGSRPDGIRLDDIVDIEAIRRIAEDFHALTGHVLSIVDLDDRFLVRVGWTEACTRFHRANPESCELCRESDLGMTEGVARGEMRAYHCKNGLWHVVSPLFVGDRRMGNIFTSQFFYDDEEIDFAVFKQRAEQFGYDRDEYLAAIRAVPRHSRETIDALMRFYARLAEQIAALGFANLELAETVEARQRALEAGVESEARYSRLLEGAPIPIAVNDAAGRILYLNEEFTRVYGYTTDDIPTVEDWFPRAYPDEAYRAATTAQWSSDAEAAARGDGRIKGREYSITCKNGDVRIAVLSGAIMGDQTLVLMNDVTERKKAEDALRLSEAKYAAAYRTSPDAVNINRLSDGLYIEVNEGFTNLTGYTPEDVAGKTSAETRVWADPADRDLLLDGLRSDGVVRNLEARFRRKDGSETTGLISARLMEVDGVPCVLSVTRDISDRIRADEDLRESKAALERMVYDVAEAMGRVAEARDPYTQGHQQRVAGLAKRIAVKMGLPQVSVDEVEMAGLLHDIGKLRIPTEILTKPGQLSQTEFALVKDHPEQGYEILRGIAFPWAVADIAMQHQERMDGSGYPRGLEGGEILLAARILAVADVVEAMASHRPYRPARGIEAAIEEIVSRTELYDPDVVAACAALHADGELGL